MTISRNTRKLVAALALPALVALTGCDPAPTRPLIVDEVDAPYVVVTDPLRLEIVMVPEGDFKTRCANNWGGTIEIEREGFMCVNPTRVPS